MALPQTTLAICKGVPLTNKYEHTILFADSTAQKEYFMAKRVYALADYVQLRKAWDIQVEAPIHQAREWNYLYFTNADGKTWYYFITDVEYVNENVVTLHVEIDVLQSYMFDWELMACMVEREHSVHDLWGENTMDEGLDTGEYVTNGRATQPTCFTNGLIPLVASTIDLTDGETAVETAYLNGCFSGAKVYACRTTDAVKSAFANLSEEAKSDAILSLWMYPQDLVNAKAGVWGDAKTAEEVHNYANTLFDEVSPQTTLDGYTPYNTKMLQYPYNVLYVTNNNGGHADYRYEWFVHDGTMPTTLNFGIAGTPAPDAGMKLFPIGYRCTEPTAWGYDDGLDFTNFPTCSWKHDSYTLWLNQTKAQRTVQDVTNGGQIGVGIASIVAGLAGAVPSGGATTAAVVSGAGMIVSGLAGTANQLAQYHDRSTQPPSARGSNSATLNAGAGLCTFTYHKKSVDAYHAQVLDNFFTMYGYKTMRVKIPNLDSRPYFNYVKTIGQTVTGDIPQVDLAKINGIFNNGLTLWKPTATVGDYSIDNSVREV